MSARPSYVHGTSEKSLLAKTVGDVLDRAAERWPENEALVSPHQDIRWTWSELSRRVDALAAPARA